MHKTKIAEFYWSMKTKLSSECSIMMQYLQSKRHINESEAELGYTR